MIGAGYVRTMAAYNAEMNRRVYAAAARLSDTERRAEAGLFWGSIHATLNHLLWADRMWMSRFAGWEKPPAAGKGGTALFDDFAAMTGARTQVDADLQVWAAGLADADLAGPLTWYSGILQRDQTGDRALLVLHMFNHQTHHRGQVHAALTRAGEATGDTDLWLLVPDPA